MGIGHFYSRPSESHRTQTQQQTGARSLHHRTTAEDKTTVRSGDTGKVMVDNKGWRKKKGCKSNEPLLLKTTWDDATAVPPADLATEHSERRRHGWRKTIAASRPLTPLTPAPTTPTLDEVEDTKSEQSEASTPHRESRPKLIRYTSLFGTNKDESATSIFSEPWVVDDPPDQGDPWAFVDPMVIMESIYAHMCKNYMVPIPLQYTSGLFQIFDDYRRLRSQKEFLKAREREALEHADNVTSQWFRSEELHQSEIRRLELLISRGTNGIAGLMQARQGTVIDRKCQHRKTGSSNRLLHRFQRMPSGELDKEIKAKTQQVLLHRPTSPSGKMTALSRQLTNAGTLHFRVGTPPNVKQSSALSQRVKSELNLTNLGNANILPTVSSTHAAGQVEYTSQQDLSDDGHLETHILESNAFIALRELGALVARRRGLDVADFMNGLVALLTSADNTGPATELPDRSDPKQTVWIKENHQCSADDATPKPPLRRTRSQSWQGLHQKHQRSFSFEPGDDHSKELEADLEAFGSFPQVRSTDSKLSSPADWHMPCSGDNLRTSDDDFCLMSLTTNSPKPTKIPSPVQLVGRVRRENSTSSLQSAFNQSTRDGRHDSRTSIQTAFRETSSAHLTTISKSRNSSNYNLCAAESPLDSNDRLHNRWSAATLAAARAAESESNISSRGNVKPSAAISTPSEQHGTSQQSNENNSPIRRRNAGQKDAE